jgi:hypothetical protein
MNAEGVRYNSPGVEREARHPGIGVAANIYPQPLRGCAQKSIGVINPGRCPGLLCFTPLA